MSETRSVFVDHRLALLLLVVVCLLSARQACLADYGYDTSLLMTAQVQKTPPSITLNWVPKSTNEWCEIYRRPVGYVNWGCTQIAEVTGSASSFTDTNVVAGVKYEYKIECIVMPSGGAYGYVLSGIEVPVVDNRGKLVLLVDNSMSAPLQNELTQLIQDLTGDGWTVIRHDVSRTAAIADVKALIVADYQADPTNVKSLFIFGHVPSYFSGPIGPDGHELRPWPTDQYYGDMDGAWPSGLTVPPSDIELQVGRVDLANLPSFAPLTETDLLRRYLNKDHNYRFKTYPIQMKAFVQDNFPTYSTGFGQAGWRAFPTLVGVNNVSVGTWTTPVSAPYIWAYGCGPGDYTYAYGVVQTSDMKTCDPAVFTFLFGSYFGQYDHSDDLLRAELATPKYGLTCAWSGWPNWFVHHMGLGETIGYSTYRMMINGGEDYGPDSYPAFQVNLLGDPTLRLFMVAPPGPLTADASSLSEVNLSWGASPDAVLGYYIYRATVPNGPYTRITPDPVTATTYCDPMPPAGNVYYMVKAVVLQTTPSGSFYNTSQGQPASCIVPVTQIPRDGMKLWIKAGFGVTKDSAGLVSSWSDVSGIGNNVTQNSTALQPLYVENVVSGRPAVRFGGGDNVLRTTGPVMNGTDSFTTVTYARIASSSPQTILWQGDSSGSGGYGAYVTSIGDIGAGWGDASGEVTTPSVAPGKWCLISTTYDGTAHKMWMNGSLSGTTAKSGSNFTAGVFSIGNYGPDPSRGLNGDIAEMLTYNRALTDIELGQLAGYLKSKYGKPSATFSATPTEGLVPVSVTLDASASSDPDGDIVSYSWDYGDGSASGSGVVTSHTYTAAGTYTVILTATDNDGLITTVTKDVRVCPPVSSAALAASPGSIAGVGTAVTLTSSVTGGYLVQYRFMADDGTGWKVLRDFDTANTYTWAPTVVGTYQLKVQTKSTGSTSAYDVESTPFSYQVAPISMNGLRLWLRSDAGIARVSGSAVSAWVDQSGAGNNVSQSFAAYQPSIQDNAVNGRPVIHFTGGNCALQSYNSVVTGTGGFTAFAVVRFTSIPGTDYQYIWWDGGDSPTLGYGAFLNSGSSLRSGWGNANASLRLSGSAAVSTWYKICSRYISGNHQMWVNGTQVGANGKTDSNLDSGFVVGNYSSSAQYRGLQGDIAEILIYNRNLTDAEKQGVDQYLSGRWDPPVPISIDSISQAKTMAVGALVSITSPKVVTAASGTFTDGSYYIEEPGRTVGMKLVGGTAALWENITLTGTVDTDANGERIIRVQSIDSRISGSELRGLGMSNVSFKASGLLVTVWGKVKEITATYLTLDDGSGSPIKVEIDGLAVPITRTINVGNYVSATGPAGLMAGANPAVKVRSDSDIQVY